MSIMAAVCRYRYDGDFEISRAYITTYAGGSSREQFAPDHDQEIEYAADYLLNMFLGSSEVSKLGAAWER